MGYRAPKFLQRAPRYTLTPQDNRVLRYARKDDPAHSFTTRFIDISTSGLAFVTDAYNAPHISDMIKVEFPISGGEKIAWWARVVRVEEYAPHKWYMKKEDFEGGHQVRVAIQFQDLPAQHRKLIEQFVDAKFKEISSFARLERLKKLAIFLAERAGIILFYSGLALAAFGLLYYLSRPDANYDAEKGAPWGERYPSLKLTPKKSNDESVETQ